MTRAALLVLLVGTVGCTSRNSADALRAALLPSLPVCSNWSAQSAGSWLWDARTAESGNGVVRMAYPLLNGPDQQAGHTYWLLHDGIEYKYDSGYYGDYTYWVTSMVEPPIDATVVRADAWQTEVLFRYEHSWSAYGGGSATILKRIATVRCFEGVFVSLESRPLTTVGEREVGTGGNTLIAFSSAGVVAVHPDAGQHVSMGILEQPSGPWWVAQIDAGRPLIEYLVLARPMLTYSYQFAPGQLGYLTINSFIEGDGWDVFSGAIYYDGPKALDQSIIDDVAARAASVAPMLGGQ